MCLHDVEDAFDRRHLRVDGLVAERRQPAERHGEDEDEHQPEPEHRRGVKQQREHREERVDDASGRQARERSERRADQECEAERREREQQRRRQSLEDEVEDRPALAIGIAEVQREHAPEMGGELHQIRLVEPVFLAQIVEDLGIGPARLPRHDHGRIARRGADQHEVEGCDHQDHGYEPHHPGDDQERDPRGAPGPRHDL